MLRGRRKAPATDQQFLTADAHSSRLRLNPSKQRRDFSGDDTESIRELVSEGAQADTGKGQARNAKGQSQGDTGKGRGIKGSKGKGRAV